MFPNFGVARISPFLFLLLFLNDYILSIACVKAVIRLQRCSTATVSNLAFHLESVRSNEADYCVRASTVPRDEPEAANAPVYWQTFDGNCTMLYTLSVLVFFFSPT